MPTSARVHLRPDRMHQLSPPRNLTARRAGRASPQTPRGAMQRQPRGRDPNAQPSEGIGEVGKPVTGTLLGSPAHLLCVYGPGLHPTRGLLCTGPSVLAARGREHAGACATLRLRPVPGNRRRRPQATLLGGPAVPHGPQAAAPGLPCSWPKAPVSWSPAPSSWVSSCLGSTHPSAAWRERCTRLSGDAFGLPV